MRTSLMRSSSRRIPSILAAGGDDFLLVATIGPARVVGRLTEADKQARQLPNSQISPETLA